MYSMQQVLIIDETPLFRDFLKDKLLNEKLSVEVAYGRRDGFAKLNSMLPDLLILDATFAYDELIDFLEKKRSNPNASKVPVIMTGPVLEREQVAKLALFNVIKYFNKPIKIDIFFETIGKMLRVSIPIDTTPCILEAHVNENIIFIEIAQGLNREKISLLRYKISELIDQNQLVYPKVLLMMTDLRLSFVDGTNLELLFNTVLADPRIRPKNVKILSLDKFTKSLIEGHKQYEGIEVANNLSNVINSLVKEVATTNVSDLITDKILASTDEPKLQGSVQMRFHSESGVADEVDEDDIKTSLQIAIVDDDQVTRTMLHRAFSTLNSTIELFDSGSDFLVATNQKHFDIIILDIFMPGLSGFDILANLKNKNYASNIIILSSASQKEVVVQALSLGAKSYLVKPLKPELVVQKAVEIINARI